MSEKCHKCDGVGKLRKWGAFGEFKIIPCPECTVTVPRETWERMQRDNATMKDALEAIRLHGTDKPAAMGGPDPDEDVSWWKSIARSCMQKANNALKELATPSHAGEET